MEKMHLCIRFYADDTFVCNTVSESNLKNHMEYNHHMRPGCLFFVDGKYAFGGCLKPEPLAERIRECEERIQEMNLQPGTHDTIPYR